MSFKSHILGEKQQVEPYRLYAPLGLKFEHALESPGGPRLLGLPPEFLSQQAQEFAFLLNSCMLLLVIWGSHFGNHQFTLEVNKPI